MAYKDWSRTFHRAAQKRCLEDAEFVAERARAYAPVRTRIKPSDKYPPGHLRDSIEAGENRLTGGATVWIFAEYWPYVQYGTYKDQPQPFVSRALDDLMAERAA